LNGGELVCKIYRLVYFCPMSKAERTREQILQATAPVFNQRGYDGATLQALCEATGLTKGALYGNFGSKEALAREAFRHAMKTVRRLMAEKLKGKQTAKEKLLAVLGFYAKYVYNPPLPGGCPLLNTSIEADDYVVEMKEEVATALEATITFIARLIEEGKKNGEFMAGIRAREYATLFFCAVEGALMVARVSPTDEAMKTVVRQCKRLVEEISISKS